MSSGLCNPLLVLLWALIVSVCAITMLKSGMRAVNAVVPAKVKQSYVLLRKKQLSGDSYLLRYGLPEGRSMLGVQPSVPTCIKVEYEPAVEGHRTLAKSYSPVSHPNRGQDFELIVKAYPYREGGGVGKYLCDMEEGASIQAALKPERVMHGHSHVIGRGWNNIGLVAGGTGIAPLVQIATIALDTPHSSLNSKPTVHLLFINHTLQDILAKDEIQALVDQHPQHFYVTYAFTREQLNQRLPADTHNIRYLNGRGDANMAKAALPKPSAPASDGQTTDTMVLVCGRDGFVAHWAGPVARQPTTDGSKGPKIQGPLLGVLAQAGFTEDQVFKY